MHDESRSLYFPIVDMILSCCSFDLSHDEPDVYGSVGLCVGYLVPVLGHGDRGADSSSSHQLIVHVCSGFWVVREACPTT